jgi:cellulose synthase/poly-beta-1,6-N-acetylglucosamine synthase-like glycosyltransferase
MKATLLISVYKNTHFLKAVLDSLLVQTCKNFEIVISEDGESEEMRSFIELYPFEQPHLHLSQPDNGWRKNIALNRAIQASSTDYLILIDGDCVLHPRFIEMHLRFAEKNCILAGKRIKLNESLSVEITDSMISTEKIESILRKNFFELKKCGYKFIEEGFFISPDNILRFLPRLRKMSQLKGCNMSFPKKAILDINGFDENYVRPAIGEDIDLTWRFQMAGYKLKSMRNLAVQYHLHHKENWTSQEENVAMMRLNQSKGLFRCLNGIQKSSDSPI